jgi:hypothetical protein
MDLDYQIKGIDLPNGFLKNPNICSLQATHLTSKDTHRLKVKGNKRIIYANVKK